MQCRLQPVAVHCCPADRMAHARGDERVELRGYTLARLAMVLPHSHFGPLVGCCNATLLTHSSCNVVPHPRRPTLMRLELQSLHGE